MEEAVAPAVLELTDAAVDFIAGGLITSIARAAGRAPACGPTSCWTARPKGRLRRAPGTQTTAVAAGGVGGALGVVAGAPLDVVRVRQQAGRGPAARAPSALQVFRRLVAREGALSLWKGSSYPLYTTALQVGWAGRGYG